MPQYAPDLIQYTEELDGNTPVITDTDFLARCLSSEAPMTLVATVASTVTNIDTDPVIDTLTKYERGRIMSALNRKKDSVKLYSEALGACDDPETRGHILINLAEDTADKTESEQLLRQAVQEGHAEAMAHLGLLLIRKGQRPEAIEMLKESIQAGAALGVPILGEIYMLNLSGKEQDYALDELITMARSFGIESPEHEVFGQLDAQYLVREEDGSIFNLLKKVAPIRAAIDRAFSKSS